MGNLVAMLLGDNPVSFTFSFVLNLVFIAVLWFYVKPLVAKKSALEEEVLDLRDANAKKDDELYKATTLNHEKMDRILDAFKTSQTNTETLRKHMEEVLARHDENQRLDHAQIREIIEQIRSTQQFTHGILMGNAGIGQGSITKVK